MAFKRRSDRIHTPKNPELYRKHCKFVAELLQGVLAQFDMKVKVIDVPPAAGIMDKLEKQERVFGFSGQSIPIQGQANPQQIMAFGEMLRNFIHITNDEEFLDFQAFHMALNAPTMSGKTGLINVCSFMGPILYLLTGKDFLIKRLLINNNTLESQSDIALQAFFGLYSQSLEFEFDGHTMTLEQYKRELTDRIPELRQDNVDMANFRSSNTRALAFEQLKKILLAYENLHLIACCDEAHYRTDRDSVLHKMIRGEQTWIGEKICYVAFSATNYAFNQFAENNGQPIVTMPPSDGYVGYGWVGGKRFDMITPEVISLQEFDEMSGAGLYSVRDVKKLDPEKNPSIKHCDQFRKKWMWAIYHAAKYCLISSNTNNAKGMVIRGLNNNTIMEQIVCVLNRMFGQEIIFILYNGDTKKEVVCGPDENPVETMITQAAGPPENRRPYVLIGTGEFRCGNDLGRDCLAGLEFNEKMEPQVLMQSIAGRMTGYKGRTIVILSGHNVKMLKNYILTGKWQVETKRGTKAISPCKRHVVVNHVKRVERLPCAEMDFDTRKELNKFVREHAKVEFSEESTTGYEIIRRKTGPIFPIEMFDKIGKSIKRIKSETVLPASSLKGKDGKLNVAIRSVDSLNLSNMGGGNTNFGQGAEGDRKEPALIVDKDLNIVFCQLYLANPVQTQGLTKRPFYVTDSNN